MIKPLDTIAKAVTDNGSKLIAVGDDLFQNRVEQALKNRDNSNLITEMATEQVSTSIFFCCHCCHVLKKCSFKHIHVQTNVSSHNPGRRPSAIAVSLGTWCSPAYPKHLSTLRLRLIPT
jgi:hypothetical protein